MSRSWTPEKVQTACEIMKSARHMGYEEFCEALDEQQAKAALEWFAKVQTAQITCPRCGKVTMKDPIHTNALSRFADVYVCDMCGMAEALISHAGQPPKLRNWAFIETVNELFSEQTHL